MIDYLIAHWPMLTGSVGLGAAIGILTGFFGAGGGFILTPALNIILGLSMNMAVGTSACQILGASAFSLYNRLDRRLLGIRVALFIGLGIPLGSYGGTKIVGLLKSQSGWVINGHILNAADAILMAVFAVFLLLIGGWMFIDNFYLQRGKDLNEPLVGLLSRSSFPWQYSFRTIKAGPFSILILLILGLCTGFLSGLLGIGGGVVLLPMLYYLVGQETKHAVQTSLMLIFLSGLFGTVFHAIDHNIDYPVAVALLIGAFAGTKWGTALQEKAGGRSIRKYFSLVVLLAWVIVVLKLIYMVK